MPFLRFETGNNTDSAGFGGEGRSVASELGTTASDYRLDLEDQTQRLLPPVLLSELMTYLMCMRVCVFKGTVHSKMKIWKTLLQTEKKH